MQEREKSEGWKETRKRKITRKERREEMKQRNRKRKD